MAHLCEHSAAQNHVHQEGSFNSSVIAIWSWYFLLGEAGGGSGEGLPCIEGLF